MAIRDMALITQINGEDEITGTAVCDDENYLPWQTLWLVENPSYRTQWLDELGPLDPRLDPDYRITTGFRLGSQGWYLQSGLPE